MTSRFEGILTRSRVVQACGLAVALRPERAGAETSCLSSQDVNDEDRAHAARQTGGRIGY